VKQVNPGPGAGEVDVGLAPVDLRGPPGRVDLRDEHLAA